MPERFFVGNISPGTLRLEFVQSCLALNGAQKECNEHDINFEGFIFNACGPYLDDGRNRVVEHFMQTEAEWLLFIDSDIAFTTADVIALIDWAKDDPEQRPIVGGAYFSPKGGEFYAVAYRLDAGKEEGPYVSIPRAEIEQGEPTPTEVDGLGTGFMLIHRTLLARFKETFAPPQPWFAELVTSLDDGTPVHMGEDLTFCARAQSLGYPVWLHRGVRVTHYKTVGLTFMTQLEDAP